MRIAVITGASSGMGRDFVRQLSEKEKFDEIWVIARRRERLEELQQEIKTPLRPISLDLTKEESIEAYAKLLEEEKPEVAVLVNGSGYGAFEAFENVELSQYYGMVDLNVKAMMGMTYRTLPYMKEGGEIYQICSLSSFQPVPYICVYGATKAFALSFSRAMNVELKSRGIRVLAICPGWVKTEFFDRAVTDESVITYYHKYFESADVVKKALKDMKKGKDVSILGFSIRVQVLLTKLLPHRLVMWIWCRQQKK